MVGPSIKDRQACYRAYTMQINVRRNGLVRLVAPRKAASSSVDLNGFEFDRYIEDMLNSEDTLGELVLAVSVAPLGCDSG